MYKIWVILVVSLAPLYSCGQNKSDKADPGFITEILKESVLRQADWALQQKPVTVTADTASRSAGGIHDFYSEGDYWWPDPANPDGPYIQKDGLTNPENFTAHRLSMIRFSQIVGSLASAYLITKDSRYALHAQDHARAWFADTATMMNPHLLYAQAIKGKVTGRGIGIIDAIHFMEVVKGLEQIEKHFPQHDKALFKSSRQWFADYLDWVTTHQYGLDEMNAKNNHGTCWVMQVAVFAGFTKNETLREFCRKRYQEVLLPTQMAVDGSFPLELKRTKPYGYSLFNLDAMATICQELSDAKNDCWNFETAEGKSIKKGIEWMYPYIKAKASWPYPADVMYWDNWPVAHPFLVFGGMAYNIDPWLDSWKELEHQPEVAEVIRNLPVRNPLLWYNHQ